MEEKLFVLIKKVTNNPNQCSANPFFAKPNSDVTFQFPGEPNVKIEFQGDTPFDVHKFDLKPDPTGKIGVEIKTVSNSQKRDYKYKITWPGGG